jgi:hypothetical protein
MSDFDKLTREYERAFRDYQILFEKLFELHPVKPGEAPPVVSATEQELQRLDELEGKLNGAHKQWLEAVNRPESRQRKT